MSVMKLTVTLPAMDSPTLNSVKKTSKYAGMQALRNILLGVVGGNVQCSSIVVANDSNAVAAYGNVTFATAVANDTITVGGVTFTAKDSGANTANNEFNLGNTNALSAAAFAARVNASNTAGVNGVVSAAAVNAVVTISAAVTGKVGNGITLASSSNTTVAVSGDRLANGAADTTETTYSF